MLFAFWNIWSLSSFVSYSDSRAGRWPCSVTVLACSGCGVASLAQSRKGRGGALQGTVSALSGSAALAQGEPSLAWQQPGLLGHLTLQQGLLLFPRQHRTLRHLQQEEQGLQLPAGTRTCLPPSLRLWRWRRDDAAGGVSDLTAK